ncbi:MAG: Gram-positive signal peptide protein family, partial [Pedosphaera sp.]|nr:Gram-positive signal peptide protein family [Pedosphaera sp.]
MLPAVNAQAHDQMTETPAQGSPKASPMDRYVPLAAWLIVGLTLLLISLRIISYGFLPAGDARRHVAKAFIDKPYSQIVVMRPEYTIDHSPGWEWLLRCLHQNAGWNLDALVSFSVAGLLLCLFLAPLPWVRRPEAWLAALLAQLVAIPELMTRLTQARPYLLTEAILIGILFSWCKPSAKNPSWSKIILTTAAIGLSVWVHGAWYLWVLPLPAFFLARWWRAGFSLTACWLVGSFGGALLTGKPIAFLKQAVAMAGSISKEHVPQWMLVGELTPSYGEFSTLALVAIVFLWRRQQTKGESDWFSQPLCWMITLCWILGFKADRFWADWGVPAVLV